MNTSKIRRIIVIAGIISLFVSYAGLWNRLISDPIERTGADFIHIYSAGRIAKSHGISQVYNLELQQDIEEEQVGFPLAAGQILPFNHLPFLIPILRLVMSESYISSFYRWNLIMISLYLLGIGIFSLILKQSGLGWKLTLLSAIGGFLFLPIFVSLMNGQDTAIVFLGAAIWVFGLLSGKDTLAGIGLSLTTVRPHIALVLALPMLFRYRKVFLVFCLGSGALALFSVLILGVDGTREYINVLLITAGGEWYGMHQEAMLNLIGMLMRTLPIEADAIRAVGWAAYGIVIVYLCILWSGKKDLQDGRIGLTVALAIFAVPHLHFHDMALLLVPIYELIRSSNQDGGIKTRIATALPIAISLAFLLSNATYLLQYTAPYLITLGVAGYPYYSKRNWPLQHSIDHDRYKNKNQIRTRPFIHAPGNFVAALLPNRPGSIKQRASKNQRRD